MRYELLHLFTKKFGNNNNVQMTIITQLDNKMIQIIFRGKPEQIHSWLSEVNGEIVFIEIHKLNNTTAVISYGIPFNDEVYKFERNSLDIEIEYLNCE